jgi:nicotinate-nucleotide--dimethylbenzimidazole phosphoribosyltransferase
MQSLQSLEAIKAAVRPLDMGWIEKARLRTAQLVMPHRALGRLHDMAERCCAIQQTLSPVLDRKAVIVMAGDHGIAAEGVSAFPQEVTGAMVQTFLAGGAGINAIGRHAGAQVWVVDMGIIPAIDPQAVVGGHHLKVSKIGRGTASFANGPAMTRAQAEHSIVTGFQHAAELFAAGVQVLGTGDMGIANTTPSAAIGAVMTGCPLDRMVGPGTGVDERGLQHKMAVIAQGIAANQPDPFDGLDVLAKVGGFEIGGIAGMILAGACHGRAVVIDGFHLHSRRPDRPGAVPHGRAIPVCRAPIRRAGAPRHVAPPGACAHSGFGHAPGRGHRRRHGHDHHAGGRARVQ